MRYLLLVLLLFISSAVRPQTPATIPFQEDFESGSLGKAWNPNPGNGGVVKVIHDSVINGVSHNGQYAVALGNQSDTLQVKKSLDLHLNLSNESAVELSFWVKANGDDTQKPEGIWLSDDGGSNFTKVINFDPENWCDGYQFYPSIDLDQLAETHQLDLTNDFVVRFVQQDNFDFFKPGQDGIFLDDVAVTKVSSSVNLPFRDSFPAGQALKQGWNHSAPFGTANGDTNAIRPGGVVEIRDTATLPDVARSGAGGLVMGKACNFEDQINALDLRLDLSNHSQVKLDYFIRSNGDDIQTQDGIYFSDDGGNSFQKVHGFKIPKKCEHYLKQPTLDVDELAAINGLNLTADFVIRFQQFDNRTIAKDDGLFLDDVAVTPDEVTYAKPPFQENFEKGLGKAWQTNRLDSQFSKATLKPSVTGFSGIVDENFMSGVAFGGQHAYAFGKTCGNDDVLNTLDLHLDLDSGNNLALNFWFKNNGDEDHSQDGIYFSDDGGQTFEKVRAFYPEGWCNTYGAFPTLDLKSLADSHNLTLNSRFVIRFQQVDNFSFSGQNNDGFFIDSLSIAEKTADYASLPFNDGFEQSKTLAKGWQKDNADQTNLLDTPTSGPHGLIAIKDTNQIPGIAASGQQAVGLGKRCEGSMATNALDLNLNLADANSPILKFKALSVGDNTHPQDGLWLSDNGGQDFTKVLSFDPENWCNDYGSFPPLSIAQLAKRNGLNLTDEFIIRFQQHDNRPFQNQFADGIFIDDVSVKEQSLETWAKPPFEEDFENKSSLETPWSPGNGGFSTDTGNFPIDNRGAVKITDNSTLPGVAYSGSQGVAMGARCDGNNTTNALDLHVLKKADCPNLRLAFRIKRNFENEHPADGIWLSNNGGNSFQKIYAYNFQKAQDEFHEVNLKLDVLVEGTGLTLTDSMILRFQQMDNNDFFQQGRDGIYLDSIRLKCVNKTSIPPQQEHKPLKAHPNPVKDILRVNLQNHNAKQAYIMISNPLGQLMLKKQVSLTNKNQIEVNTRNLKAGIYFFTIQGPNVQGTGKFIKSAE